MANKTPIKATFDEGGNADGFAEYTTGDTVPTTHGGTGLSSIGTAGQVLKVNATADGLEFGEGGGGGGDYDGFLLIGA